MAPKELNELNNEAATVIGLREFAKRIVRHGERFDELKEIDRARDCRVAAEIIEAAIPFVIQGMADVADGIDESDATKLYRVVSEDNENA